MFIFKYIFKIYLNFIELEFVKSSSKCQCLCLQHGRSLQRYSTVTLSWETLLLFSFVQIPLLVLTPPSSCWQTQLCRIFSTCVSAPAATLTPGPAMLGMEPTA